LDRLVYILNECSLHPYDAAGLLLLYNAARDKHVTTAAILSDQALEHAQSASDKDKLAIAGISVFRSFEIQGCQKFVVCLDI